MGVLLLVIQGVLYGKWGVGGRTSVGSRVEVEGGSMRSPGNGTARLTGSRPAAGRSGRPARPGARPPPQ